MELSLFEREGDEETACAQIEKAVACIFIIGPRFFEDNFSLNLLKHANSHDVKCILVSPPGTTYLAGGYSCEVVENPSKFAQWSTKISDTFINSSNPVVAKASQMAADKVFGPILEFFGNEEKVDYDCPHVVPRNAWNRTWKPYVPEVLPPFFEEPIKWSEDFADRCMFDLSVRLWKTFKESLGEPVISIKAVSTATIEREAAVMRDLAKSALEKELNDSSSPSKDSDVYLVHKFSDVPVGDVVDMIQMLNKRGYHVNESRYKLNDHTQVEELLKQSRHVVVLLTENVLESFWAMHEIRTALQLGMDIILVPVEGHRWRDEEHGRFTAGSPSALEAVASLTTFFPDATETEQASMNSLFVDGLDAENNLSHSLTYKEVFARALSRRLGVPNSVQKRLESLKLLCDDDATTAEAAETLVQVNELNALAVSSFTAQVGENGLEVLEVSRTGQVLAIYDPAEFRRRVYTRRSDAMLPQPEKSLGGEGEKIDTMATAASTAVRAVSILQDFDIVMQIAREETELGEAYEAMTTQITDDDSFLEALAESGAASDEVIEEVLEEAQDSLIETLGELGSTGAGVFKGQMKPLLAFYQINTSFVSSFPGVQWPAGCLGFLRGFKGLLTVDIPYSGINYSVAGVFNFVNFTVMFMTAYLLMLLGMMVGYGVVVLIAMRAQKTIPLRNMYTDNMIKTAVLLCFLAYPALCQRLLAMYQWRSYGTWRLIEADWSLQYDDVSVWHDIGIIFIVLYLVGIPFVFFFCCRKAVQEQPDGLSPLQVAKWHEYSQRLMVRFQMLFDVYDREAFFWEVLEMIRKMVMTAVVTFILPGSSTQIFISTVIAFLFLLLVVKVAPFQDSRLDWLSVASQTACVFTLLMILGLTAGIGEDKLIPQVVLDTILFIFQLFPAIVGGGILLMSMILKLREKRAKKLRRNKAYRVIVDQGPNDLKRSYKSATGAIVQKLEKERSVHGRNERQSKMSTTAALEESDTKYPDELTAAKYV
jgi:hypothetical protein